MKVAELIEVLSEMPEEARIFYYENGKKVQIHFLELDTISEGTNDCGDVVLSGFDDD